MWTVKFDLYYLIVMEAGQISSQKHIREKDEIVWNAD